jgi:hypothetical protein
MKFGHTTKITLYDMKFGHTTKITLYDMKFGRTTPIEANQFVTYNTKFSVKCQQTFKYVFLAKILIKNVDIYLSSERRQK